MLFRSNAKAVKNSFKLFIIIYPIIPATCSLWSAKQSTGQPVRLIDGIRIGFVSAVPTTLGEGIKEQEFHSQVRRQVSLAG